MTPERLPVLETARAVEALGEVGVNVQGVIINRILPDSIDQGFWRQHQLPQQEYMAEVDQRFAGGAQYMGELQECAIVGLERLQALSDALIDAGPMIS